jgi:DNA-binding NarL/FixJ family response regulator
VSVRLSETPSPNDQREPGMTASVAIYCVDPVRRGRLERLIGADGALDIVGASGDLPEALCLVEREGAAALVADSPPYRQLDGWRSRHDGIALVVLTDGTDETDAEAALDALHAGAHAILPRSAGAEEIADAVKAAAHGLATLPRPLLATLLGLSGSENGETLPNDGAGVLLTPRELEVLAAMAGGASNKAIARRLGISFHTAKFHVGAILAKLDADSRTEAVARAAHLGLVML